MILKTKKLWLFDLDGTLIDSQAAIAYSTNSTFSQFGRKSLEKHELAELFGTPIKQVLSLQISMSQLNQAFDFYQDNLIKNGVTHMGIFDGVIEILDKLFSRGNTLKIVTNKQTKLAEEVLEYFKLRNYFTEVLGSDLAEPKPSPALIELASKDYEKNEIVFVGDQLEDIESGNRANVTTILVRSKKLALTKNDPAPNLELPNIKSLSKLLAGN